MDGSPGETAEAETSNIVADVDETKCGTVRLVKSGSIAVSNDEGDAVMGFVGELTGGELKSEA